MENESRSEIILKNLDIALEISKEMESRIPTSVTTPLVEYVADDASSLASDIRDYFMSFAKEEEEDGGQKKTFTVKEQMERLEGLMVGWCKKNKKEYTEDAFTKVQEMLQTMPFPVSSVELEEGTGDVCMANPDASPPFFDAKIVGKNGDLYVVTLSKFWIRVFYHNANYIAAFNTLLDSSPNNISDDAIDAFARGFSEVAEMIGAKECFDRHWFSLKKRKTTQDC